MRRGSSIAIGAIALTFAMVLTHTTAYAAGSNSSLYVTDINTGFHQYTIDGSGGLSAKTPAGGGAGTLPLGIAATPDGKYVYIAGNVDNNVHEYSVGSDGALTPIGTAAPGTGPTDVIITRDGRFLYADNQVSNTISEFSVQPDGSLTSLGTASGGLLNAQAMAISPNGSFLFAVDESSNAVTVFAISSNGTLSSGVATGTGFNVPFDIQVNPTGTIAYITNAGNNTVSQCAINGSTGLFSACTVTGSGFNVPLGLLENPDGTTMYVVNGGNNTVSVCQIAVSGLLTTCIATGTGAGPQFAAMSPDTKSLYVTNFTDGDISMFTVNADGSLSAQSPATISEGIGTAPENLVALPNQGPTAAFTSTQSQLTASFDASTSSDSDGTVAQWNWNFGDGTTAINAGPTPSHLYTAAGTYTVTLTVTDNDGCSTNQVFTSQTVLCNGTLAAQVARSVTFAGVPVPSVGASETPMTPTGPGLILAGIAMTAYGIRRKVRPASTSRRRTQIG